MTNGIFGLVRAVLAGACLFLLPMATSAAFNLGVLYADYLAKPADAKAIFKHYLSYNFV